MDTYTISRRNISTEDKRSSSKRRRMKETFDSPLKLNLIIQTHGTSLVQTPSPICVLVRFINPSRVLPKVQLLCPPCWFAEVKLKFHPPIADPLVGTWRLWCVLIPNWGIARTTHRRTNATRTNLRIMVISYLAEYGKWKLFKRETRRVWSRIGFNAKWRVAVAELTVWRLFGFSSVVVSYSLYLLNIWVWRCLEE